MLLSDFLFPRFLVVPLANSSNFSHCKCFSSGCMCIGFSFCMCRSRSMCCIDIYVMYIFDVEIHCNKLPVVITIIITNLHEDSMKKLQGDCVSWLVLLTGAAQLLLVCGEGMF